MNAEEIFLAALEKKSVAEREAYLDGACGGDAVLRAQVDALLRSHQAGSFLDAPLFDTPPTSDQPLTTSLGARIGPYKLLQQIGEGGMGVVYMAEQSEPIARRVALKIIKPGMDSRQVIARFDAERQALALMDHANIARVLDAGTVPFQISDFRSQIEGGRPERNLESEILNLNSPGRPYFVMELVNGIPITRYCDDNRLTPRQRLELFVPVCQAIGHAHQKGIIHRDIKPSNVLVTLYDGRPVPKVIDFGVAKATEQKLTERTLFTQFGTLVGTLEYMSPEQAEMSALGVDTRSDIYSLGVLLYELLTGSTPLGSARVKQAAFAEILRMIREEEAPKPSTRLSDSGEALASISAQRHMEPARLTRLVRGELDWIVMKTLEKDRNRRYETAGALAMDVQRYLADEPVQACPPSLGYRLGKFARRHKVAMGFAVVVFLAGLTLLAGALWHNRQLAAKVREVEEQRRAAGREALRADANFAKTMEAVERFLSQFGHKRLAQIPGMEQVRREVLEEALQFFQGFLREQSGEPAVRREAGWAYFRVGEIQNLLGRHEAAEQSYCRARELLGQLAAEFPGDAELRRGLADCHTNLAMLLQTTGRPQAAEGEYRRAIELGEQLESEYPDDAEHRRSLARSYSDMGPLLRSSGRAEEAETFFRRGIGLQEKLVAGDSAESEYRDDFARSQLNYGLLLKATGRPQAAEKAYRLAVELWEKLTADSPAGAGYRHELAGAHLNLGVLLEETGRTPEAEAGYRRALELAAQLAADFPAVPDYRSFQAKSQLNLAGLLHSTDRSDEAERTYLQLLELLEKLAADFPEVPQHRRDLAGCLNNLGAQLYAEQRLAEAETRLQSALEIRRELAAGASALPEDRGQFATAQYNLAQLLGDLNRDQQAEAAYRQARELLEKLAAEFPEVVHYRHVLGAALNNLSMYVTERGEWAEARILLEQAAVHQTAALTSNPRHPVYRLYLGNHYRRLAQVLLQQGEHAAAAKTASEAPRLYPEKWQESLRAAEFLAGCVPLAEKDTALPEVQRRTLAESYAEQSVAWLRQAAAQGCADLAGETKPAGFDPVRMREDFRQLIDDLNPL